MKKTFALVLLLIFVISNFPVMAMESKVLININGVAATFPDAQPFIDESNRTQVPIGALAEILDIETIWNEDTQTAFLLSMKDDVNGNYIRITIGKNEIEKGRFDGRTGIGFYPEETIEMDTIAVLKANRVFIPIRYVAEFLNFTVEWDEAANCVNLKNASANSFDLSLLQSMPKDKNYMLSPFSLKMALAMVANGADGDTKREMLDVLGISDLEQFNNAAKDFISNSNKNESVMFNIANSIWHNSDYYKDEALDFSDRYKSIIHDYFHGTADKINNTNGAKTINDWISKETKDKINNVITDVTVEDCLSFLVNTIYFKGDWAVPFAAESTMDDTFTDRNGNQKTTSFMNIMGYYDYYEDADFQMLAKPYNDNNIKMYFVLPKTDKAITQDIFENARENMTMENTRLSLPKFKTEYLHDNLIDILANMGIQTAFNPNKADFLNMYSKKPIDNIYIGLILQKTFIEVDEKGTEAAAATVIGMSTTSMPSKTVDFKCDKPFTYFIRNDATGNILFMGEYAFVE